MGEHVPLQPFDSKMATVALAYPQELLEKHFPPQRGACPGEMVRVLPTHAPLYGAPGVFFSPVTRNQISPPPFVFFSKPGVTTIVMSGIFMASFALHSLPSHKSLVLLTPRFFVTLTLVV